MAGVGFMSATRQNIRKLSQETYVSGGISQRQLTKTGLLSKILLHINGTMTITPGTGTAALSEQGPWALIRRVRFQMGNGTELFNVSGFMAYVVDLYARIGYEPDDGQIGASFATDIYNAGVSTGANTWDFTLHLPIVPNDRDLAGLVLLQADAAAANLIIDWQVAGGATNEFPVVLTGNATAAFVGTCDVYLETFTVPAEGQNMPPLDQLFQTIERQDPIFATGENVVKLLPDNTYVRVIHALIVNGALSSTALDEMLLRYNVSNVPYQIDRKMKLFLQRYHYTKDFPKGIYHWDFFDQGYANYGGQRDLVEATGLAEFESLIRIASGTSLGSNNNKIVTVTQQLVDVAVPAAA